jgi:hypothetical protein
MVVADRGSDRGSDNSKIVFNKKNQDQTKEPDASHLRPSVPGLYNE